LMDPLGGGFMVGDIVAELCSSSTVLQIATHPAARRYEHASASQLAFFCDAGGSGCWF